MVHKNRRGQLAVLAPLLICLPCLAAPLLALGGALLATIVVGMTAAWWLAALLLGGSAVLVVGLVVRLRRRTAPCRAVGPRTDRATQSSTEMTP